MKTLFILTGLMMPLALAGCAHPAPPAYYQAPPPGAVDEVAQRAYHDGFEAARRDVRQERPPDVKRHPNFRNPPVPPPAFQDYRRAFRDGYQAFLHQGLPPERQRPEGQAPPPPPPPPQG